MTVIQETSRLLNVSGALEAEVKVKRSFEPQLSVSRP